MSIQKVEPQQGCTSEWQMINRAADVLAGEKGKRQEAIFLASLSYCSV